MKLIPAFKKRSKGDFIKKLTVKFFIFLLLKKKSTRRAIDKAAGKLTLLAPLNLK